MIFVRSAVDVLPHAALVFWIHGTPQGAVEVLGKVLVVAHGAQDPELTGRVDARQDGVFQRVITEFRAPDLTKRDPEQLLGRVRVSWQSRLLFIVFHPFI